MPPWATRKIAGIPAWGWAVAALGAVALGIYFRRRAIATNNASTSSDPTGLGDLANSLAGGATAGAPSGLDPALADLLNSAMGLVGQGVSDATMGGPGGYYDPGTGFDGSGDGGGQDAPAGTSVAASGAGTTYTNPFAGNPFLSRTASTGPIDTSNPLLSRSGGGAAPLAGAPRAGAGGARPLAFPSSLRQPQGPSSLLRRPAPTTSRPAARSSSNPLLRRSTGPIARGNPLLRR